MRMEIYTIYDEAVQAFGTPLFCKTDLEMVRELRAFLNFGKEDSMMQKYPQQFILYKLGKWNYNTARFDLLEKPIRLYSLETLVDKKSQEISLDQEE